MWVNRCLLGAGYAAVLVAVAVQKMWLPWSIYFGRWESRLETSGRLEKKSLSLPLREKLPFACTEEHFIEKYQDAA